MLPLSSSSLKLHSWPGASLDPGLLCPPLPHCPPCCSLASFCIFLQGAVTSLSGWLIHERAELEARQTFLHPWPCKTHPRGEGWISAQKTPHRGYMASAQGDSKEKGQRSQVKTMSQGSGLSRNDNAPCFQKAFPGYVQARYLTWPPTSTTPFRQA